MQVHLVHSFQFEAAHQLPRLPVDHKCRRLHGHGYRIEIEVAGPVDPELGWLMDFADLKRLTEPLRRRLDHQVLNEVAGLENPTSEMLCAWIWQQLAPSLPELRRISVLETCTCRCDYYGPGERA